MHRNELLVNNCHLLTWYRIFKKNGGLNLVLWLTKPPALMAMLNMTLKFFFYDMTTILINGMFRIEKYIKEGRKIPKGQSNS